MTDVYKTDAFTFAKKPSRIPIPGNKVIEEFIGLLNSETEQVSVARMVAPPGWEEPEQTPEFDEITIVLSGKMRVEMDGKNFDLKPNQPFLAHKNCKIRYSNPFDETAEYWAICIPAFSIETVNREQD
jgi:mannose-6-phosphate isomerase-like protein (cupin superfamily)